MEPDKEEWEERLFREIGGDYCNGRCELFHCNKIKQFIRTLLTTKDAERDEAVEAARREVLQGIYDKGLPDPEQIRTAARGWGKEGSERYEGYISGANDVIGLVTWEMYSHGIVLDTMPYYEPTPEDQKATDIMGYVLGAWLGAILAGIILSL